MGAHWGLEVAASGHPLIKAVAAPWTSAIIEDTGTGDLIIKASTRIWMKGINDETLIRSTENSQISLYHNGAEKLSTLSNGIYIYGSITAGSASITGELTADRYN